jgi:hypothetical protein
VEEVTDLYATGISFFSCRGTSGASSSSPKEVADIITTGI